MSKRTLSIPIVDLSPFTSAGDLESRKQAARDFAEKGHANGCVGISGHGVPSDMLEKAFQLSEKFFSLPYEEK
jgi:isopenicillin N synthase-like dioxygenase